MSTFDFLIGVIDDLVDVNGVIDEDTLLVDLGLASLDYIEVQVLIKNKYKVVINADLFESGELATLGDMINYIDSERLKLASPVEA